MTKKTYMCIQRSESGECEPPSPSDMQKMYAKFTAWQEKFADNIVDMGGKLGANGKVVKQDAIVDGPFVETKEIIGGYMIITANSIEEATQVVQESPGVGMPGSSVEIREINRP